MKETRQNVHCTDASIHHIHMIAICGTAMGALACMLKEKGFRVTGSDVNVYPPMSDFLYAKGIDIFQGFKPDHLRAEPDLVVVGNAVSRDNPEVQTMLAKNMSHCSMPQAINRFAAAGKKQVVITGTHGKTTTSAFIAWLLQTAGLDPSFLIGGLLSNFNSNYRVGQGEWIVLEGDEYDTAYFDKGPKFLHYQPAIAVLTSVEFDHADIFQDLAQVKQAFGAFVARLAPTARLIHCDSDDNIAELIASSGAPGIPYGRQPQSQWRLGDVDIRPPVTRFDTYYRGRFFSSFTTPMIGEHNLLNLLAGIAVGHLLGLDADMIGRAMVSFQGVQRRQQVRGVKKGVVVLDDFAHHPTAVKATLKAVRSFYRGQRVIAVFEPRTNSSRRKVFQASYAQSFDDAALICIRKPPLLEKIPEAERFSSAQLAADLQARGKEAHFFEDTDAIIAFLERIAQPMDVILIMSNGGFDHIHQRLLDRLDRIASAWPD